MSVQVGATRQTELVPASTVHTETLLSGIDEALLISAYDIQFGYVAQHELLRKAFAKSTYARMRVLFIDSGWYEKTVGPEAGPWYHEVGPSQPFEREHYEALIDALDPGLKAVLVGWDNNGSYDDQIRASQAFFARRPRFSAEILLKPEGTRRFHDFGQLSRATAGRLRAFAAVGVTEKELGDTIMSRLIALASLRELLDSCNASAPLHVFGGLDPLATPLYFAAGGEIFDGLGWLRYAYRDGLSLQRDAGPLLDRAYGKRGAVAELQVQLRNLDEIAEIGRQLKVFFHNGLDWNRLRHGKELRPAFETMQSTLEKRNGR
jgi:hypothetical protein